MEVNFISPVEEVCELLAPGAPLAYENNQIHFGASFTTHNLDSSHVPAEVEGLNSSAQLSENAVTAEDEEDVDKVEKGSRIVTPRESADEFECGTINNRKQSEGVVSEAMDSFTQPLNFSLPICTPK